MSKKSLIIYFTLSGNTQAAAQQLQQEIAADLYRLQPSEPYSANYDEIVARGEQEKDQGIEPAIAGALPDLAQYDRIYIGYPIWWSRPPMIIHSLFAQADFSGKQVTPFATSASTPLSATLSEMSKLIQAAGATLIEE